MKTRSAQVREIRAELANGMRLKKCRQCGCMQDILDRLESISGDARLNTQLNLATDVADWQEQMEPVRYACLGCKHCYPAVATNLVDMILPDSLTLDSTVYAAVDLPVAKSTSPHDWPVVPGEYFVICDDSDCPVAVSTLASPELAGKLADLRPEGLCIVGKTETENIGIDKVVKNTITNPALRHLIIAGREPEKHYSGNTLLALWQNGVDEKKRVIGARGKRPVLNNITVEDVRLFRAQVDVIDLINCEDTDVIIEQISRLANKGGETCACNSGSAVSTTSVRPEVPVVQAREPVNTVLDKNGYFVIIPNANAGKIVVEHYAYDNRLLRIIEGNNARDIYRTIIENRWVKELSHAAYLGRELTRAELALEGGLYYVQDGA